MRAILSLNRRMTRACGVPHRRGAVVASTDAHYGEKDPLRGSRGSERSFFRGATCAAFSARTGISRRNGVGRGQSLRKSGHDAALQEQGCHNIKPRVSLARGRTDHRRSARCSAAGLISAAGLQHGGYTARALALLDGIIDTTCGHEDGDSTLRTSIKVALC